VLSTSELGAKTKIFLAHEAERKRSAEDEKIFVFAPVNATNQTLSGEAPDPQNNL
jgi:hypothetical protein